MRSGGEGRGAVGVVKAEATGIGARVACFCMVLQGATQTKSLSQQQGEKTTEIKCPERAAGQTMQSRKVTYNVGHGCLWRITCSRDPVSTGGSRAQLMK